MIAAAERARRLPGVRFEAPPPPVDPLPRMDVAVLVGIAAAGPLHVPVAIEDSADFAAIFGEDAPLAWDGARRAGTFAHLGPAVRAFFRNGGRRCWVVRVAAADARAGEFSLPGLFRWSEAGPEPARMRARSEGSWSDAVRAGATLSATPMEARIGPEFSTDQRIAARLPFAGALRVGDLLRVSFRATDGASPHPGWTGFVVVREVSPRAAGGGWADLRCDAPRWFHARPPGEVLAATPGSLDAFDGRAPVSAELVEAARAQGEDATAVRARVPLSIAPEPGAGICFAVRDRDGKERRLFFMVTRAEADDVAPDLASILHGRGLWLADGAPTSFTGEALVERLSLAIWTHREGAPPASIAELAFTGEQPRSVWALPTDEELLRAASQGAPPAPVTRREHLSARAEDLRALWAEAATPRFALAGWDGAPDALCLPIGMALVDSPLRAAAHDGRTPLERDGLTRLTAGLFLDPDLAGFAGDALLDRADLLRYGPSPRSLRGIHAALDVEEATLIAVPDAAQWPWDPPRRDTVDALVPEPIPPVEVTPPGSFASSALRALGTPELTAPALDAGASIALSWRLAAPITGARWTLEQATAPSFVDAIVVHEGEGRSITLPPRAPGVYYFRARALVDGLVSAWSNGVSAVVSARVRQWAYTVNPALAPIALDVHAEVLRLSAARGDLFAVLALPERFREQEASAHLGALSAPDADSGAGPPPLDFAAAYHPWLIVAEEPPPLAPARTGARVARVEVIAPPRLRAIPPDGAALGMMAARTLARGAWIAPANQPFADVVALTPSLSESAVTALDATALNLVRRASVGFTSLGERTLSDDPERARIHVRRLLSLLRRVALRVGGAYVFEPNGQALRRAVQGDFEQLLGALFQRGAFAGRGAEDSYRVITDAPIDTGGADDEVVLAVDLRVAPAAALSFVTVRLVQRGGRTMVTEGA